ncbi:hypothetical protein QJQ58_15670 [Paenibacillus dendritiformis]|uniref:Ig-like domain-containing protein n=1 Tax=Paenibacillus dendritiformis TaxID=130049 RepID=UPI00248B1650|nr:hypothetical protein [Paenibacillus dendritiformis]WGU92050.1 hypothetical protein QJQ58_15670 [Paenibacillus dendritiformis]
MSYQNKYRTRMNAYGGSQREARIINNKNIILSDFNNSPAFCEVYINNSPTKTGVQIVSDTKTPTTKKILMKPNHGIHTGDIIKWRDEYWLCMSDDPNQLYTTGFIERCNTQIKWIDENGFINDFPCVLYYNSRSSFGVKEDKIMTLPNGRRQIAVQKNESTEKIKRGRRFIFGKEVFKTIDFDSVSDFNIVNLSLESDLFSPATDNLELGIADYYNSLITYKINILNGDGLILQTGGRFNLQVEVLKNGEVVENPKLSYLSSNESVVLVNHNGQVEAIAEGTTEIIVNYLNTSSSIEVTVTDEEAPDNFLIVIKSTSTTPHEIKKGRTKEYFVEIFNHSQKVENEHVIFELFANNQQDSTWFATITEQDGVNCTIKNNDSMSGYIQLKATLKSTPDVTQWIRIQMRPLF